MPAEAKLGNQQTPGRLGQVPVEISSLHDSVCSLENNLSSLEKALKTVLSPVPGDPKQDPECGQDISLVSSQIKDSRIRIQDMDDRILSILERLEL